MLQREGFDGDFAETELCQYEDQEHTAVSVFSVFMNNMYVYISSKGLNCWKLTKRKRLQRLQTYLYNNA